MLNFFARALRQAQDAEAVAADLRSTYGERAETACQVQLEQTAPNDPRNALLRDALRALRWVQ